jgi:hypothetical protein
LGLKSDFILSIPDSKCVTSNGAFRFEQLIMGLGFCGGDGDTIVTVVLLKNHGAFRL